MSGASGRSNDRSDPRGPRRWLVGYLALLFGTLPFALPVWRAVLQGSVGRVLTVEQLHVMQYSVAGWLAGRYAQTLRPRSWRRAALLVGIAGLGVFDEVVQQWLPGRFFDWSDAGWNLVGAALGLGLSSAWGRLTRAADVGR